jgi:DNA-binding response OmpR family regulator
MATAKILICDDEPALRQLLRISLTGDYDVEEAADTAAAAESVARFAPDLILLDLMMPGASGFHLIERLRRSPSEPSPAILVISAFATDDDRDAAQAAGADSFLAKPFDPDALDETVAALLAARS